MVPFFALTLLARADDTPLDVGVWDRVRIDVPDWPGAESTSETGSVLLAPPEGVPWRIEAAPELDLYDAWEAADALQVEPWHEAGFDGTGVKVAVFDSQWYQAELVAAELGEFHTQDCGAHPSCEPAMDTLRPQYSFEAGSHGVACAEVIRDLAPGVELYLVRVNGATTLENATAWAVREGIDVISMSLSFFSESFYDGTGPINDQMDRLAAAGVLMVKSAGNYAEEHWVETFTDDDGDGLHEFDRGPDLDRSEYLAVYLGQGDNRIYVTWDEFSDCGATDLDAIVVNANNDVVGRGEDPQVAGGDRACEPVERVSATAASTGWHWIQVRRTAGQGAPRFNLYARGGEIWRAKPNGSLVDPATHPDVFVVGAVRADATYTTNDAESFSSVGPTLAGVEKPDIAGPNGLSTSVYGPTGFYGTSASTPAVAAAVALLMSEDPTLGPYEAADRLRAAALTGDAVWQARDPYLGDGRARLPTPGSSSPSGDGCSGRGAMALPLLWWWLGAAARRRAS